MKGMHLWNPRRYKSTLARPLLSPKDLLSFNSHGFNKATQLLLTTFTHANQITCLFTSTSSPHIQCFSNLHSVGICAEQHCISEPKTLMTSRHREILASSRTFSVKQVCGSCRLCIPKLKKKKKNQTWPSCVSAGLLLNFGRSSLSRCKARFSIKLHSWSGQSWFMCQSGDRLSSFLITFNHVTHVSSCLSPTGTSVWRWVRKYWGLWTRQLLSQLLKPEKCGKIRQLQKEYWSLLFNGAEHRTISRVFSCGGGKRLSRNTCATNLVSKGRLGNIGGKWSYLTFDNCPLQRFKQCCFR